MRRWFNSFLEITVDKHLLLCLLISLKMLLIWFQFWFCYNSSFVVWIVLQNFLTHHIQSLIWKLEFETWSLFLLLDEWKVFPVVYSLLWFYTAIQHDKHFIQWIIRVQALNPVYLYHCFSFHMSYLQYVRDRDSSRFLIILLEVMLQLK